MKKVARNTKFALLSPYYSYFETMPSKNSKDLIGKTLVQALRNMLTYLESVASDSDCEPASKRRKVETPLQPDSSQNARTSKLLQKKGALAIGMKETAKAMTRNAN